MSRSRTKYCLQKQQMSTSQHLVLDSWSQGRCSLFELLAATEPRGHVHPIAAELVLQAFRPAVPTLWIFRRNVLVCGRAGGCMSTREDACMSVSLIASHSSKFEAHEL